MKRRTNSYIAALSLALLALPGAAPADDSKDAAQVSTAKQEQPAFKATSHRRFDDVEYWSGVFDDPERDAWQKPDEIVHSLDLTAGDRVADLGAGTGYLLSRLSGAVGESGTVYAVEVELTLVDHIRSRAENNMLANVVPVFASPDNPRLPHGGVDLVLILDTYHHLDERKAYLERLRDALADDGRIAIIDWKKKPLPVGPPPPHKLAREQIVSELTGSGFALTDEYTILENQYFLIFEPQP